MARIIADISVSLDGYVTGPDVGPSNGLGTGGEALHRWAFSDEPSEHDLTVQGTGRSGAVLLGRHLFDQVDGPDGWNDEVGYGAREVGEPAFVVVAGTPPEHVRRSDLDWTFVTTGIADAIETGRERALARSASAGRDLDVVLMGGGELIGSALDAGLVETLQLHIAPVVLGGGTPLFRSGSLREFTQRSAIVTANAVHVTYDVG